MTAFRRDGTAEPFRLSVIIPVYNGGDALRECLEALAASRRPPDEVIVVDDGSTDGSALVANAHGARVVPLTPGPFGPARGRNAGAEVSTGEVLVFVDADVRIHADALELIERYLEHDPDLSAVFGSYDDDPPHRNVVSRYKNLSHHFVHHQSRREAVTFWGALGAVRREPFLEVGGFDDRYARPSIEDIELGNRLKDAGHRIWLCKDVQGTHLKRWTLRSMLRSDIFDRAIPWSRLIAASSEVPADLNLGRSSRASAVSAWAVVALAGLGWLLQPLLVLALLPAAVIVVLNRSLYRLFLERGGVLFMLRAAVLHFLYLLYSSLVFLAVWIGGVGRQRAEAPGGLPVGARKA